MTIALSRRRSDTRYSLCIAILGINSLTHIHSSLAGATTLAIAYGIEIQDVEDPYLAVAEEALTGLAASASPGMFLVDSFPILKYVPSWMPGAEFRKNANGWKARAKEMFELPFVATQQEIVRCSTYISNVMTLKIWVVKWHGKAIFCFNVHERLR